MQRRFVTLDVFTTKPFAGNPLAIVIDGDGLSSDEMQTIAREFNLAETVFVMPPKNSKHAARIRIFTPTIELPFAGHPTVGTAVWLGCTKGEGESTLILEEEAGLVACVVQPTGGSRGHAKFIAPQLPAAVDVKFDVSSVAAALQLSDDDIGVGIFKPARWSAGVAFNFVPLRGLDAMARAKPDLNRFDAVFGFGERARAYLFCTETADKGSDFHARMFAPAMGIPEDPATGSAAAAFTGLIASVRKLTDGEHSFRLEQGYEMGRPSLIELGLTIEKSALVKTVIGGSAVMMSGGVIEA